MQIASANAGPNIFPWNDFHENDVVDSHVSAGRNGWLLRRPATASCG